MSSNILKVFGPPGCGKTTRLLNEVEVYLNKGVDPQKIGFFSFTNKAADEARDRARLKFSTLKKSDFKYFRTLHSLAYGSLSGKKSMQYQDWKNFSEIVKIPLTINDQETSYNLSDKFWRGDYLRAIYDLSRMKKQPLELTWKENPSNIQWAELSFFVKHVEKYKVLNNLVDYTDMITLATKEGDLPQFELLLIDEAQDLSTVQWDFVDKLVSLAQNTVIAGDDDQAIFEWAGADVKRYINYPGKTEILSQSYRVPASLQKIANYLKLSIKNGVKKNWHPRNEKGLYKKIYGIDSSEIDLSKGEWLILGRTHKVLESAHELMWRRGYYYLIDPRLNDFSYAIKTWEMLCQGKEMHANDIANFYSFLPTEKFVQRGFKTKIKMSEGLHSLEDLQLNYGLLCNKEHHFMEIMLKMGVALREFIEKCIKNGEDVSKPPRIKVSTVHGAKGGEAENVVIYSDLTTRPHKAYDREQEEEFRIWYVAVTRAKKNLYVILPTRDKFVKELLW